MKNCERIPIYLSTKILVILIPKSQTQIYNISRKKENFPKIVCFKENN